MKYEYNGKQITPSVEIYHDVVPFIGGISARDFFLDAEKCAKAWKVANAAIADYFGELLAPRAPMAGPFSYGHMVSIGAPVNIPDEGEPNVTHFADSIDDAIAILKNSKGIDFGDNDMARHYKAVNKYLQEEFPEYNIRPLAGYSYESIITSAELMRGQDFFCDIYDEPEKVHELLTLITESLIDFYIFLNGKPTAGGRSIYDDFASLIPPYMWQEFVIPYWNKFFDGVGPCTRRFLHCENVYPEQLRYLKDAKIDFYQPSVSPRLTLENIRENTDVPFDWLLYAFDVVNMSDAQIENWVDTAVKAGVTKVRTQFGRHAWEVGKMDRILAFYKAFEKYRVE